MPTGREPVLKLKRKRLPASLSPVGHSRKPEPSGNLRTSLQSTQLAPWAAGPSSPQALLTLGVSFLECVAGVHKAGGRVVLALELQVQLGRLAESVSGS